MAGRSRSEHLPASGDASPLFPDLVLDTTPFGKQGTRVPRSPYSIDSRGRTSGLEVLQHVAERDEPLAARFLDIEHLEKPPTQLGLEVVDRTR